MEPEFLRICLDHYRMAKGDVAVESDPYSTTSVLIHMLARLVLTAN
jgi:hypothetical protein